MARRIVLALTGLALLAGSAAWWIDRSSTAMPVSPRASSGAESSVRAEESASVEQALPAREASRAAADLLDGFVASERKPMADASQPATRAVRAKVDLECRGKAMQNWPAQKRIASHVSAHKTRHLAAPASLHSP